jgi:acyl-[acyl-carrier-protein]-phospholipid O-acyltransferase / long-chain-fatty-acid--[acyl-carrier-protein] ligase
VSLGAVEELAVSCWPQAHHAAVAIPDPGKGEQIVLVTDQADADRTKLLRHARERNIGELNVPKSILTCKSLPLLGSGKVDMPAVQNLVRQKETT